MTKFITLFSVALFLSSAANAGKDWEGEYDLDTGMKITRKIDGLLIQDQGKMSTKKFSFSKGFQYNNCVFKDNGCLSLDLTQDQFKVEVLKIGNIKKISIKEVEKN